MHVYIFTKFLTLAIDSGWCLSSLFAALIQRKSPPCPLDRRLDGPTVGLFWDLWYETANVGKCNPRYRVYPNPTTTLSCKQRHQVRSLKRIAYSHRSWAVPQVVGILITSCIDAKSVLSFYKYLFILFLGKNKVTASSKGNSRKQKENERVCCVVSRVCPVRSV